MSDVARVKVTVLDRGPRGSQGPATIELGTVTVVNPDQDPSLVNSGTAEDLVLDADLPRAAQVDLGTVTVVDPDQPPTVADSGTDGDVVLDVELPRAADVSVGTVTTADPGDPATVADVGVDGDVVLNFAIPAGETGITWRGEWDATTTYAERDAVRHRRTGQDRESSYIALEGSTGVEPPAPGDAPTAEWDLLAEGGEDGGGAETLGELSDVDTTGAADGQALLFDDQAGLWVPGSAAEALGDLTDVDTDGAQAGQALVFDGAEWLPGSAAESLDDLDDVDAASPDDGDVLAYDDQAGEWVASGAYVAAVDGLVVNDHDDDEDAPRIPAAVNYWRGSVEPVNGEPGDLLYLEDD